MRTPSSLLVLLVIVPGAAAHSQPGLTVLQSSSQQRDIEGFASELGGEDRWEAAWRLGKAGPAGRAVLIDRLADPDWRVGQAAAWTLGTLTPPEEAVEVHVALLAVQDLHPELAFRHDAEAALWGLFDRSPAHLLALTAHPSPRLAQRALDRLRLMLAVVREANLPEPDAPLTGELLQRARATLELGSSLPGAEASDAVARLAEELESPRVWTAQARLHLARVRDAASVELDRHADSLALDLRLLMVRELERQRRSGVDLRAVAPAIEDWFLLPLPEPMPPDDAAAQR